MDINVNINASNEVVKAITILGSAIEKLANTEVRTDKIDLPTGNNTAVGADKETVATYEPEQNNQAQPVSTEIPVAQQVQQQTPVQQTSTQTTQVPVTDVQYSMDQLAVAATGLMDAGKRDSLVTLLGKFGVQALTMLPKEQYGAFATELRGMGANI